MGTIARHIDYSARIHTSCPRSIPDNGSVVSSSTLVYRRLCHATDPLVSGRDVGAVDGFRRLGLGPVLPVVALWLLLCPVLLPAVRLHDVLRHAGPLLRRAGPLLRRAGPVLRRAGPVLRCAGALLCRSGPGAVLRRAGPCALLRGQHRPGRDELGHGSRPGGAVAAPLRKPSPQGVWLGPETFSIEHACRAARGRHCSFLAT